MRVERLAILVLFSTSLGIVLGWYAREKAELQEIAAAVAAEREAVYGTPIHLEKPWTVSACASIAAHVERGHAAQEAEGKKSLFMGSVERRLDPDAEETGEAIREISEAWDRYVDGLKFFGECVARLAEKRT